MTFNRRQFVRTGSLLALGFCVPTRRLFSAEAGRETAVAAAFDREVEAFMKARHIPGGALAVVKDRRLVYARGYGWANQDKQLPATPESLFRIASISKPITAVAVLQLIARGKLSLDDRAFDIVKLPPLLVEGKEPDPRLRQITIRQLLHHTSGWDRDRSFDPMFRPGAIAKATGMESPPAPAEVIRYMLGRPLDFDPGSKYAYSNLGYCILGRVIETVTGTSYARHVQARVLQPAGIRRMRIGGSLVTARAGGEVAYYHRNPESTDSVFARAPGKVAFPDGGFCLETMDAHGGWIASAVDLARFAAALHEPRVGGLISPATAERMYAPPPPPVSREENGALKPAYYGCGWMVRPVGKEGRANYWHSGSLPGTATLLVRRWDGLSWAVLFNQRSEDSKLPDGDIDPAMHRAAAEVKTWPEHNLFGRYA
jgi:N-acyl-D-amino-acid deacylase